MSPPLISGALSDDAVWRLSVAYIGPKSRTERPRKTKIGAEVAHVARDSDTTFKVKGQGHQAALLTAALTRQAAAAVTVGTYWPWEPTAALLSAGAVGSAARGASAPTEGGEGRGHIVAAARLQLVVLAVQEAVNYDKLPDLSQFVESPVNTIKLYMWITQIHYFTLSVSDCLDSVKKLS